MIEKYYDNWAGKYARRMQAAKSSAVRDLMGAISRPDIISLAGGFPITDCYETADIEVLAREVLIKDACSALQYGPAEGFLPLKESICGLMEQEGIDAKPEEIAITAGAQQGLDLISKIFIDPGDVIAVEEPTYVGALNSFHGFQADFVTIPMDDHGMVVDVLEEKLKAGIERLKLLYTVPSFQNPSGITLSLERRHKLAELAQKYKFLVLEDTAYNRFYFNNPAPPAISSLYSDLITVGSFSKIFSPGLRVGWVKAPQAIIQKINLARQAADLCPGSLTQRMAHCFLEENLLDKHVEKLRPIYRERCNSMLTALEANFPLNAKWTRPQGGFFVWVELPSYLNTHEMLAEAISRGVAYVPGLGFYPDNRGSNTMRLAFCYAEPEKIETAIIALGEIIKEQIELYQALKIGET